jgi:hypothetical protein
MYTWARYATSICRATSLAECWISFLYRQIRSANTYVEVAIITY